MSGLGHCQNVKIPIVLMTVVVIKFIVECHREICYCYDKICYLQIPLPRK